MPPHTPTKQTRVGFTSEEKAALGYNQKHPVLLKQHEEGFESWEAKRQWIAQYGPYFKVAVQLRKDRLSLT
jgi:hypothetical protein